MSDVQLRAANPDIDWIDEECLVDVRTAFGVGADYSTAAIGWAQAAYKHAGATPPSDLAVPIWFSYNGPDGHVALWDRGTIYSSSSKGKQTFASIQALVDWMDEGFKYLGYSEDIDGVRVAEIGGTAPAPAPSNEVVVRFNAGTWDVRSGESTSSAVLGTVNGGQEATVVIQSNGWGELTFVGRTAYVGPATFTKVS